MRAPLLYPFSTFLLTVGLVWLVTSEARAQNLREVLLGGRTATMGGAGTAAGNDSAMPYLNPAGLAGLPTDVLAVSASVYAYTRRSYKGHFFTPNGVDPAFGEHTLNENVKSEDLLELPSSVMYVRHFGEPGEAMSQILGMSLIIPRASRENLLATFNGHAEGIGGNINQQRNYSVDTTYYHLGPSYAVDFEQTLRLGVSAHLVRMVRKRIEQSSYYLGTMGGTVPMTYKEFLSQESHATMLAPTIGIQATMSSRLQLGAAVAVPSIMIHGKGSGVYESSGLSADPASGQPLAFEDLYKFQSIHEERLPLRINIGFQYEEFGNFAVAGDLHYYAPQKNAGVNDVLFDATRMRTGEVERQFKIRSRSSMDTIGVLDTSFGVEFNVSKTLSLRAGGFTDLTDMLDLQDDAEENYEFRKRLDRFGATLGLGYSTGSFDSTLGLFYVRAMGTMAVQDIMGDVSNMSRLGSVDMTTDTIGLILSSSVSTSEASETIEKTLEKGGVR